MKQIIYVATSGEYSDYHIIGLFSNKKLAEDCLSQVGATEGDVEEWELDGFQFPPKGKSMYWVTMNRHGSVHRVEKETDFSEYDQNIVKKPSYRFDHEGKDLDTNLLFAKLFAKSKEHAVKIVNEKRIQLIESDRWGKNETL